MLARFAENDVSESCMLVGAKSQVFRWLALARKRFREFMLVSEKSQYFAGSLIREGCRCASVTSQGVMMSR